MNVPRLYILCY